MHHVPSCLWKRKFWQRQKWLSCFQNCFRNIINSIERKVQTKVRVIAQTSSSPYINIPSLWNYISLYLDRHENAEVTLRSVGQPLCPRFLFPSSPSLFLPFLRTCHVTCLITLHINVRLISPQRSIVVFF